MPLAPKEFELIEELSLEDARSNIPDLIKV